MGVGNVLKMTGLASITEEGDMSLLGFPPAWLQAWITGATFHQGIILCGVSCLLMRLVKCPCLSTPCTFVPALGLLCCALHSLSLKTMMLKKQNAGG